MDAYKVFSIIAALTSGVTFSQPPAWINPHSNTVQTVFYQGMNTAQTQGAKYTGDHGFIATTGEHVVNKHGIDVIQNIFVKPEIDEVLPASNAPFKWSHVTIHPKALFYASCRKLCHIVTHGITNITGTRVTAPTHYTPTHTIAAYALDVSKINIGQEGDIANHKRRFEQCRKEHPNAAIIAYGVSRGASTTFESLAQMNKESKDLSSVKLCVVEGCFDSVPHVMQTRYYESVKRLLTSIVTKVSSFKADGPAPIKMVQDFPKHIPIAFITSRKDKEVPMTCTQTLIDALRKAGHSNIHVLILEKASHPNYMWHNFADRNIYQNFIHALYAKYNLPHIPEYAQAGKDIVERSKVTN